MADYKEWEKKINEMSKENSNIADKDATNGTTYVACLEKITLDGAIHYQPVGSSILSTVLVNACESETNISSSNLEIISSKDLIELPEQVNFLKESTKRKITIIDVPDEKFNDYQKVLSEKLFITIHHIKSCCEMFDEFGWDKRSLLLEMLLNLHDSQKLYGVGFDADKEIINLQDHSYREENVQTEDECKKIYSLRTEAERYNVRFKATKQERLWIHNLNAAKNLNTIAHITLRQSLMFCGSAKKFL